MTTVDEQKFLNIIKQCINLYINTHPRSGKKTQLLHSFLQFELQKCFSNSYKVLIEQNVPSYNISQKKRCDIIVFDKEKNPFIVFPVKFIMSNYKQNKNNMWENLTGECFHLKNKNLKIIPINIILSKTPYKNSKGIITKFENIEYDKSFKITEILVERKICYDIIIDVEHELKINENYLKCPKIIGFNEKTSYRKFKNILKSIID